MFSGTRYDLLSQPPEPPEGFQPWFSCTTCSVGLEMSFFRVMSRDNTRAILLMIKAFPARMNRRPMDIGIIIIAFIMAAIINMPMVFFIFPRPVK